jgi:hypothetical protein
MEEMEEGETVEMEEGENSLQFSRLHSRRTETVSE